ncbi:MAG: hypothetical protein GKR88_01240 [Flavobacteriaceae bacterium]|nr:MAG: hypothetical protein GKR88_01240 [Flavobacteriaceae bacterium]
MKKITYLLMLLTVVGYAQTTLIDFETATTWTDFDGGVMTTETNPYNNSDNNSANVGKMVKNAGQPWGGSWTDLGSPIDFSSNNAVSVKVYSPRVGAKLLFKVENETDGGVFFQQEATTTMANAWETLTYDFSSVNTANSYQKVVLIFDNGTVGDGSANFTFYVDDITLYLDSSALSQIDLPVNFEGSTTNYTVTDFGGNASMLVTDPANSSNNVIQSVKTTGAEIWAGTTIGTPSGFATAIPFTATSTKMSVKVRSPLAFRLANRNNYLK